MPVLKVKLNGEWVPVAGGSGGSNTLTVIFTSNDDGTITSSHSGSEIKAAAYAGKSVIGINPDAYQLVLGQFFANAAMFTATVFGDNVQTLIYYVDDNKNVTAQTNAKIAVPTPTESDYGKILSATADGLVWVEQTILPAAEEASF